MNAIIVAMSSNRVIGRENGLPWHLPRDLKHFKDTTMGHTLVMGRKTYDSVGFPLPGRQTIVISRSLAEAPDGTRLARSLDEALAMSETETTFVAGGGEIYAQSLDKVERIYLTLIEAEIDGDTVFPELGEEWVVTDERSFPATEKNPFATQFLIYERA